MIKITVIRFRMRSIKGRVDGHLDYISDVTDAQK